MPYRDKELDREYKKLWARRKRANVETRTTPKPTSESIKKNRRERFKRNRKKRSDIIDRGFGECCYFCGHNKVRIIHRKDGKSHKEFSLMGLADLNKTISMHKDEYVRVCGICHKGIHWCMKFMGMTWEEIEKGLKVP